MYAYLRLQQARDKHSNDFVFYSEVETDSLLAGLRQ